MRLLSLAALFALVAPATAHASGPITWRDFDKPLPVDCDIIDATIEQNVLPTSVFEIRLDAAPEAFYYKGVQFWDRWGYAHLVATEGAKRTDTMQFSSSWIGGGSIHFEKAQTFGIHTGVYDLNDVTPIKPGSRVTFHWAQDTCPDIQARLESSTPGLPGWMKPGEVRTFKVTMKNTGVAWRPDNRMQLEVSGYNVDWQQPPIPITTRVNYGQTATFDITLTAPNITNSGRYLDIYVRQRDSSATSGYFHTFVEISPTPPKPPPPPPPPTMVTVPNVVGLSAADTAKAIYGANLKLTSVNDPNPLDPKKHTVYQSPMAGTRVVEKEYVQVHYELDSATSGWKSLNLYNCGNGTLVVYRHNGDRWEKRGELPAQWRDNVCPVGGPGFTDTTIDKAVNFYVAVDPTSCSDPSLVNCHVYQWQGLGDAGGYDFYAMAQ